MVDKNKNKKKKTYKKKYTSVRDDYRKGGRVSYQRGEKVEIDPRTGKALPITSIERPMQVGEPVKSTVQPKTIPQEVQPKTIPQEVQAKAIPQEDRPNNVYEKFINDNLFGKAPRVPNYGRTGFERNQTGNTVNKVNRPNGNNFY
jgi:hypothetical protein